MNILKIATIFNVKHVCNCRTTSAQNCWQTNKICLEVKKNLSDFLNILQFFSEDLVKFFDGKEACGAFTRKKGQQVAWIYVFLCNNYEIVVDFSTKICIKQSWRLVWFCVHWVRNFSRVHFLCLICSPKSCHYIEKSGSTQLECGPRRNYLFGASGLSRGGNWSLSPAPRSSLEAAGKRRRALLFAGGEQGV